MPYFQRLMPPDGLGAGYVALLDTIDIYALRADRAQDPRERALMFAKAEKAREILRQMWRDYDTLSVRGAAKADALIRSRIRNTQVRPDASGRLRDSVLSRPLVGAGPNPWPGGAIGIADLDVLEKGAVHQGYESAGSYWRTQEYGYAGHVGRRVVGFFQPGSAKPSPGAFRLHPFFEPTGGAGGRSPRGTPAMVIRRPIQARHFMRDGTDDLVAWRALQMAGINRRAISELARL